jgi:G3E family GTPase
VLSPESAPAVTIIGGSTGVGKTTLREQLVRSCRELRFAVLDNVDGPVGDSDGVGARAGEPVTMGGGCICCSLRGDLVAAIVGLVARAPTPDHILIEASGAADLGALAMALAGLELRGVIRHTSVLAVFDAERYGRTSDRDQLRRERRQLRCADLIVLAGADRVGPARVTAVEAALRAQLPSARILIAERGWVAPELALGVGELEDDAGVGPRSGFDSWRYRSSAPLAIPALRRVLDALPSGIVRSRGVVHLLDAPAHRALVRTTGRRCQLLLGAPWGRDAPASAIVFFGRPGEIDKAALQAALDACAAHRGSPPDLSQTIPQAPWLRS